LRSKSGKKRDQSSTLAKLLEVCEPQKGRLECVRRLAEEQDARIALMDHFASYLQYWGAVLVGLAVAFFSLLQFRCELSSAFDVGLALLASELFYAFFRIAVFGKLLERAIRTEKEQPAGDRMTLLHWLHEEILGEVRSEWLGFGRFLIWLGTWFGWISWTLFGALVGLVVLDLTHLTRFLIACA
jgi:hypothetical protein